MKQVLVVFAPLNEKGKYNWFLMEHGKSNEILATGACQSLEEVGKIIPSSPQEIIYIISGSNVTSHYLTIPNGVKVKDAVPFLMEEFIGAKLSDVHFIHGPSKRNQGVVGFAIQSSVLKLTWDNLTELGFEKISIIPDYICLGGGVNTPVIIVDKNYLILREKSGQGFSIEADCLSIFKEEINSLIQEDEILLFTINNKSDLTLFDEEKKNLQVSSINSIEDLYPEGAKAALELSQKFNLLGGVFDQSRSFIKKLRPYSTIAALFLVSFLSFSFSLVVSGFSYINEREKLEREILEVFQDTLPNVSRVVNPVAQLKNHLNTLNGNNGPDFLFFSGLLFAAVDDATGVSIESIRYESPDLRVFVRLNYKNLENLSDLVKKISGGGFEIEEGASQQLGDGFSGEIIIRERT